jgi:hypothetical protein
MAAKVSGNIAPSSRSPWSTRDRVETPFHVLKALTHLFLLGA